MTLYADQAREFIRKNPALAREIAVQFNSRTISKGLTERQRDCLVFIRDFVSANGFSPSFEEIREALGLASRSGVHRLVHDLEERGYVHCPGGKSRALSLRVEL